MDLLEVRVVTPRGEVFATKARSVSSANSAGKFDVLPQHANFVTYLENVPIRIVKEDGSAEELKYPLAIMLVGAGIVTVYTDVSLIAPVLY